MERSLQRLEGVESASVEDFDKGQVVVSVGAKSRVDAATVKAAVPSRFKVPRVALEIVGTAALKDGAVTFTAPASKLGFGVRVKSDKKDQERLRKLFDGFTKAIRDGQAEFRLAGVMDKDGMQLESFEAVEKEE